MHGRTDDGTWSTRVAISGGAVAVESLGLLLRVDDVYRGSRIA
ncbi:MAG TPA: hypothetical protein VM925_25285 [Labilithrix sp.]|nr:hypothetical protein [Labilithrix sp.]